MTAPPIAIRLLWDHGDLTCCLRHSRPWYPYQMPLCLFWTNWLSARLYGLHHSWLGAPSCMVLGASRSLWICL